MCECVCERVWECVCVFECVSTLVQQILHATFFSTLPSFLATKSLRARFVPRCEFAFMVWFSPAWVRISVSLSRLQGTVIPDLLLLKLH